MAVAKFVAHSSETAEIQRLVETAQRIGQADNYDGKRRFTRFAAGTRLEVKSPSTEWRGTLQVNMQNVSEGGFAFWSRRHLSQHTRLLIREFSSTEQNEWLPATVRHCTVGLRGYLVGAAFDDPAGDKSPTNRLDATGSCIR